MHILKDKFAVFWSSKGSKMQFHADISGKDAADAAHNFRTIFPNDIIRSVRNHNGRFQSFKVKGN